MSPPEPVPGKGPWRATESEHVPIAGIRPKSVFQIGAGTVGTGSLRGMPFLAELRRAGFSIWPFDRASAPGAGDLPRALTGPVDKSSALARSMYLQARHGSESGRCWNGRPPARMPSTPRSAPPPCSASPATSRLARLPRTARDRREGRIWVPPRDPVFERWA
ncbi:MAG: hypothetical protein IPK67_18245 [Planctomycetes bacterium]|nr:hypothetical protein [Planctomycetota bacterium]